MKWRPAALVLGVLGSLSLCAAAAPIQGRETTPPDAVLEIATLPLWNGPAPGAQGQDYSDIPTISVFRPHLHRGNGTAVIVAPGGGYIGLAGNLEGRQVADWFAARGVTAFVLKYRLAPRYRHPAQLQDAQRAIRLVRSQASAYGIAPDRIGMIGFSAGGHLTAMTATHFDPGDPKAADPIDRASSRPDFIILGYPLTSFASMQPPKNGRANSYLGPNPSPALIDDVSPDRHVTAQTPPAFIYATTEDEILPVEQSVLFYRALHAAGVSVEMHLFAQGRHGSGLGSGDPSLDLWPTALENWFRARGLLSTATEAVAEVHTPGPLSIDATMGELLKDPAAHAILQQELPQFVSSPQMDQARDMSLRSLQQYAPQLLTSTKLEAVDQKLKAATALRR